MQIVTRIKQSLANLPQEKKITIIMTFALAIALVLPLTFVIFNLKTPQKLAPEAATADNEILQNYLQNSTALTDQLPETNSSPSSTIAREISQKAPSLIVPSILPYAYQGQIYGPVPIVGTSNQSSSFITIKAQGLPLGVSLENCTQTIFPYQEEEKCFLSSNGKLITAPAGIYYGKFTLSDSVSPQIEQDFTLEVK